jgi:hypothetical protein
MMMEMRTHFAFCANPIPINPLSHSDSKYQRAIVMALCNYISHQPKVPPRDLRTLLFSESSDTGGGGDGGNGGHGGSRGVESENAEFMTNQSNEILKGVCLTNLSSNNDASPPLLLSKDPLQEEKENLFDEFSSTAAHRSYWSKLEPISDQASEGSYSPHMSKKSYYSTRPRLTASESGNEFGDLRLNSFETVERT